MGRTLAAAGRDGVTLLNRPKAHALSLTPGSLTDIPPYCVVFSRIFEFFEVIPGTFFCVALSFLAYRRVQEIYWWGVDLETSLSLISWDTAEEMDFPNGLVH